MKKEQLESSFKAIFRNSYQAILHVDSGYTILDYNSAAAGWIRRVYRTSVRKGDSFLRFLPREDSDVLTENVRKTLDEGHNQYKLFSIIAGQEGEEYWTEYQFYPVVAGTQLYSIYIFIFDITERKNVIDEIARSTRRFYSLIKNSSDIVSILDADGVIHFISDSVEKILNYPPGELVGKNFFDFIFAADYQNFKTAFTKVASIPGGSFISQCRFRHREEYWVFLENLGSNHLEDESIGGIILNSRDITERRHFEEMLMKISRQNELILESAGEGIFGLNRKGKITFANPAASEMIGLKIEDMIGKDHHEVIQQVLPDGTPCNEDQCLYFSSMQDGVTCNAELAYFKKTDDLIFPVEYISTPIREKGDVVGAVVTFNDISERKRNEEELRKAKEEADAANRAKSDFLANVSHEIRTPINNILGFLELLNSTELDKTQHEYVNTSRDSARTLLDIISDILDYSKIEKGKIEIDISDFTPGILFESTVELFAATAAEKNLGFYCYIDPDLPDHLEGDSLRIRQVLNNLISNAIKFTPSFGNIFVEILILEYGKDYCMVGFSVKDTGIGVPIEKQRDIFSSFTQADSTIARKYGGTGLGLSISSNLVHLMGGKLQLESTPGKGSRFYFELKLPFPTSIGKRITKWKIEKDVCFYLLSAGNGRNPNEDIISRYLDSIGQKVRRVAELSKIIPDKGKPVVFAVSSALSKEMKDRLEEAAGIIKTIMVCDDFVKHEKEFGNSTVFLSTPVTVSKIINAIQEIRIDTLHKTERKDICEHELSLKGTILVVEDTPASQKLMKIMLEKMGLTVDIASDGKTAIYMFMAKHYDLVFMDINMPEYDGIETTKRILEKEKKNGKTHVPIVALTAKALKGDREKYMAEGMDEYISKPVDFETLRNVVHHFIGNKTGPANIHTSETAIHSKRIELASTLGLDAVQLDSLIQDFINDSDEYLNALCRAVSDRDMKGIEFSAHKIRGIAATFQFDKLSAETSSVEGAAAQGNTNFDYVRAFERIKKELCDIRERYQGV